MKAKDVFRLVRYLRSITKGNKEWYALTNREGYTVIRCYDYDTEEMIEWYNITKRTFKGMKSEARYTQEV